MSSAGGSRFRIDPDPPIEGEPLDVTYVGPAGDVEYQIDGQSTTVTPDANGNFRIDQVPSGAELVLSDNRGLPGYMHREIFALGGDK